jgi:hypothetical protein
MKKVPFALLIMTVGLVGTAQAGLVTFDFEGLPGGADDAAIGSYMTALYGSSVTVTGAASYPYMSGATSVNPLPALSTDTGDQYIASTEGGNHQFSISFSVPIVSLSFDWAREADSFHLEASYAGTTQEIFTASGGKGGGSGYGWETIDLLDIFGGPVTTLFFHDGGQGAIGIDNLVVNAVPLPTSILLGIVAVGLAGRKLRRFV